MTQFERLTELIGDEPNYVDCITAAAEYLIENGVIVPPCKIGDTVYYPSFYETAIIEGRILRIVVDDKGISLLTEYKALDANDFGKSVFFTREEAEKALTERATTDES